MTERAAGWKKIREQQIEHIAAVKELHKLIKQFPAEATEAIADQIGPLYQLAGEIEAMKKLPEQLEEAAKEVRQAAETAQQAATAAEESYRAAKKKNGWKMLLVAMLAAVVAVVSLKVVGAGVDAGINGLKKLLMASQQQQDEQRSDTESKNG